MKVPLLFLAFLLYHSAQTSLFAQSIDFAPIGAKWHYTEESFAPPKIFPHIIEVVGKEIYHGKLCSKIAGGVSASLPEPCYVYTQNDSVFFYSLLSNQFEMLYDFTAKVGESWVIGGLDAGGDIGPIASDTVTVDSISEMTINGTPLKVWHISNTYWFDWGDRIIETVGNDGLFGPKFGLYDVWVWGLRCFESPDVDYHFVPYPCDTVIITSGTSIPTLPSPIHVSPNPFHDKITVSSEIPIDGCTIRLYDQTGRLVREQQLAFGNTEIEVGALNAGIYFWQFWPPGAAKSATGKCIKILE